VNAADTDGVQHQGERTWYVYDAAGQRVRKVTEQSTGQVKSEHIYLDGFELYRRNGTNPLVRETLHMMDDKRRIAIVETRTQGSGRARQQLIRYQHGNHLASVTLELDDRAQIISYEEYTPYGSTSYQAVRSQTEAPRQYRYCDKERDEETRLYYNGARYYAPWQCRWISCDPQGPTEHVNAYLYVLNNPVIFIDRGGREAAEFLERYYQVHPAAQKRALDWQQRQENIRKWEREHGAKLPVEYTGLLDRMTDPREKPFEQVMLAKETGEVAHGVAMATLWIAGGEIIGGIPIVQNFLGQLPRALKIGLDVFGAAGGVTGIISGVRGKSLAGNKLGVADRSEQLVLGPFVLLAASSSLFSQSVTALEEMNAAQILRGNKAMGTFRELTDEQQAISEGYKVIGRQVTVTAGGRRRIIDTLLEREGGLFNLESKAGGAQRKFGQQVADEAMATTGAKFGKKSMNAPAELRGTTQKIKTIGPKIEGK